MQKYFTSFASFVIMLFLGSVYAWSVVASELIKNYGFSASKSQIIFGTIILIFPITMIFVGKLGKKISFRYLGYISGFLFFIGYFIASLSQGSFISIFIGIGIIGGISTGFGYWISITSPVQWFPNKKGLITGISAAGFGLGAVIMAEIAELILNRGHNILFLIKFLGIVYGIIIVLFSNFIYPIPKKTELNDKNISAHELVKSNLFKKLFIGIFLGTFAGLLIIGSLKIIGGQLNISENILILGVGTFALANFIGRLIWGYISDHWGASLSIFLALLLQSISIFLLNILIFSDYLYLIITMLIGIGFGGNFVLFAKATAQIFGLNNLGTIYPYVFIGYAIAGITGPLSGGILYDLFDTYFYAIILAGIMSLFGSSIFLNQFLSERKYVH